MLSRTKSELRATEDKIAETAKAATEIIEKAAQEGRSRTDDENAQIAEFHKSLETLKANKRELEDQRDLEQGIQDSVKDIGTTETASKGLNLPEGMKSVSGTFQVKTLGEQFVESEGYKHLREQIKSNSRPQQFSTGLVDMQSKAGTLLEGGQGAGYVVNPQVVPGVVEKLFQRLTVADLLPSGQTSTSSLRYLVEGTATNGAAGVAEGGTKPASDLALSTVDEPVKKIATILTVSDEMLEDAQQVQSYINGRLSLFVKIEEERQLVLGAGTNELVGITGRSGVNTYTVGTVDNNAVALFKALNTTRGSSFLEPDAIIMHPSNWQTTRLLMDANQQFYGGGPFTGAYGNSSQISPGGGQLTGGGDSIWNKPIVVTTAITAGTALLGSFSQAAQLFRRGGLTVEATNAHASYFTSNLVAIRAEERLALAVYRPVAFTKVVGLS